MDEDTVAIRTKIQQQINCLMGLDMEFRIRGLRDLSHVAFMAQFLNTFRAFPLQEQERQLQTRIQLLRRILDMERSTVASTSEARSYPVASRRQLDGQDLSTSHAGNSEAGTSTFDTAHQIAAIKEREELAFTKQDILERYRSYRRFAIGVIRANHSTTFKLTDLHSAFDAAKKEAVAQQSGDLPPHFKLTRSDNIFSNRVMKFSELRRAADIGDLDGLTCEIINRVKSKGNSGSLKTDAPPADAAACRDAAAESGMPDAPSAAAMARAIATGFESGPPGPCPLVDGSETMRRGDTAHARRKRQRALPSPEVRVDLLDLCSR
jgi:hypothetical protein